MNTAIFRDWNFELPIVSLTLNQNGDWICLAMADGSIGLLPASVDAKEPKIIKIHEGVSLSLRPDTDGHSFLSGGDDGKIFIIDPLNEVPTLLVDHKGSWVDHVASNQEGYRAYTIGKKLYLLDSNGQNTRNPILLPSSAGGLEFSPNGKRLAVSHYNGVSLIWVNSNNTAPESLFWKGSHLKLKWHPEGKILITGLQENALHGWRLLDNKEMQMQGYVSKIHSMDFTLRGRYLVTSGAEQVVCWPFIGGGPWGKPPLTLGGQESRLVKSVAAHPKEEMIAAGYEDGMIILAPLDGRMEIMISPPKGDKKNSIIGLQWTNQIDNCLFAACENGSLALFTPESVKRLITNG